MLKICLAFWKSEPLYAYKRYAYKKNMYFGLFLELAEGYHWVFQLFINSDSKVMCGALR